MLTNSADGSKILNEDDRESDEEIEKYVDDNIVGIQKGIIKNSKCTKKLQAVIYKIKSIREKELKKR